ncbi:MAG: YfiM family protein, partial [Betaproteobacteria bacterium]|nr:YfiM family protein [Betaproteobacteria bacterium]
IPYRYTQALTTIAQAGNTAAPVPAEARSVGPAPSGARVTPQQLRWRNAMIIGGGVGLVAAYGANNWWQDGFQGSFRSVSEGWFGQSTQNGGADKLGHAFFSYAGARVLTAAFSAAGNDADSASKLGALWSLGVMTGVEVLDGFSKKYRFSSEDALMNLAGAAAGYIMERNPKLDALVDFRLHYRPSESGNFNIGGDYSGQTYLLAIKASGVPSLRAHSMLRYFELAVGYGTRGFESPPQFERSRNFYFGVSLNLSELLSQTAYRGNRQPTPIQRTTDVFFELIQLPGTAVPLAKHPL